MKFEEAGAASPAPPQLDERLYKFALDGAAIAHIRGYDDGNLSGHTEVQMARCPHPDCLFVTSLAASPARGAAHPQEKEEEEDTRVDSFPSDRALGSTVASSELTSTHGRHGRIEAYAVEPDDDGEWHRLTFTDGWQIQIFTDKPLVIIEPETH
jgi:hypothetical protein